MEKTRRAFLGTVSTAALTGLAGCTGGTANLAATIGLANPTSRAGWSTVSENVAVAGQPTIADGVPAAWGAIAHTPEEAHDLLNWDALINTTHGSAGAPTDLKNFDAEKKFVIVIVGVLPYGRGLTGLNEDKSDIHFEGETVRNEVTSYQAITSNADSSQKEDPDEPEYWYDYSISLWDRNGTQEPTSIEVTYHK